MKTTSYPAPQPEGFSLTAANLARAETICAPYPERRNASATISLLDLAQLQNGGWLSGAAIEYVDLVLEVAPIRLCVVVTTRHHDVVRNKWAVSVCAECTHI